jgi:hypothetical protein
VTLCARANGLASFPDPNITVDNVTWPAVTPADLSTLFDLCKYAVERLPDKAKAGIPAKTPAAVGPFADPFDFCAAIGTRNAPDARYTGPAKPPAIVSGLRAKLRIDPGYDNATFEKQTSWRCVRGELVACSFADQSPCSAKASLSVLNTGEPEIQQYCAANPDTKAIPKSVDAGQIYELPA